jgi:hypothetical protein
MKSITVHRRQVLRGTSGFALGIPFLPSLFPRRADGAELLPNVRPRFVAFATEHGGISESNMYPMGSFTQTTDIYTNHKARHGALKLNVSNGMAQLSPVLRGPSSVFTDRIAGKMNVLRGFDVPYYIGHHSGAHLGNYVRSDQGPKNMASFASIDQVMAWSSAFYPNLGGIKQRAIATGQDFQGISFTWTNPTARSGGIVKVGIEQSVNGLFDKLIAGSSSQTAAPRRPVVDRILASYRSLRESNRRLSGDDRVRLDGHMSALAELERTVKVVAPKSCGGARPGADNLNSNSPGPSKVHYGKLNDLIAMAFACGTTRIFTVHVRSTFADFGGSWHQDVAHQHGDPGKQAILAGGLQKTFEATVLDLAAKLDAVPETAGVSMLDTSLIQWTQESDTSTHNGQGMGIVTAGSANGFLKTGLAIDYRNTAVASYKMSIFGRYDTDFLGLGQRQWLATALLAMGVPKSEWEKAGVPGYGDGFAHASYKSTVRPEILSRASDVVPLLQA